MGIFGSKEEKELIRQQRANEKAIKQEEKIMAKLAEYTSEIEDANCDVLRASIALQLMIYGYDNSNMPDADKIDSFRLIGAFLRDTWNKLTDAQWAIDCALRDIKEGAENGKEQSSTRRGKSPKEDSYPQR